jgi:hypothetical protein
VTGHVKDACPKSLVLGFIGAFAHNLGSGPMGQKLDLRVRSIEFLRYMPGIALSVPNIIRVWIAVIRGADKIYLRFEYVQDRRVGNSQELRKLDWRFSLKKIGSRSASYLPTVST